MKKLLLTLILILVSTGTAIAAPLDDAVIVAARGFFSVAQETIVRPEMIAAAQQLDDRSVQARPQQSASKKKSIQNIPPSKVVKADGTESYAELGSFIKGFMLDTGTYLSWYTGADGTELPISWLTSGVASRVDGLGEEVYERVANGKIKVDGFIMTQLRQKPTPLEWNIALGSKWWKVPEYVSFTPDDNCFGYTGSGCAYTLDKTLSMSGIESSFLCSFGTEGEGESIYSVSSKGKERAYLVQNASSGSGGESNWTTLHYAFPSDDVKESIAEIMRNCNANEEKIVRGEWNIYKTVKECISQRIKINSKECKFERSGSGIR